MRKTNINKYRGANKNSSFNNTGETDSTRKLILKVLSKAFITFITIFLVVSIVVVSSLIVYTIKLSSDEIDYDITAAKLHLTSMIYVNDENGNPQEYSSFHSTENRLWVDFSDIPDNMKNAVIAIEDKRFWEHNGVDWVRTCGATLNLITGRDSYGGSTLTQQLIKNLTDDNEVSLTRKLREIFRALNFEKKYSKDEIIEAYLNVVNFGNGCRGVQSAANTYFNKDIEECSAAECAAIAGITQNPSAYNPLIYPENNKTRREVILNEMHSQGMLSDDEYNQAMEESKNMVFTDSVEDFEEKDEKGEFRNWYIDTLYNDVHRDLMERLGMGEAAATDMILTQGLKIYCSMDKNAQEIAENVAKGSSVVPNDEDLQLGYFMMDYSGRVLAVIGGKGEKQGDLIFNMATDAIRQPGSTIKPIGVYAPAIDLGILNYSSIIKDEPITKLNDSPWPKNSYGSYRGNITVQNAIQNSSNAAAVQALASLTPQKSAEFLKNKLHFTTLEAEDAQGYSAYATGGMTKGVTVREMTASFQIFGNGGMYYKPYTYFKVVDRNGKVLLDNENQVPTQAISSQTATIMNRLLRTVVTSGTGTPANISGWDIFGKTGTTDNNNDSWFVGGSPYAVAGTWIGYKIPESIPYYTAARNIWRTIMSQYLEGKAVKDFVFDQSVKTATYCEVTGRIADTDICGPKKTGYYAPNNMPGGCGGNHAYVNSDGANNAENSQEQNQESSIASSSSSLQSTNSSEQELSSSSVSSASSSQASQPSSNTEMTTSSSSEENRR